MPAIADVQSLWEPAAPYLNTASFGLPPRPAWDALQAALADWHHGRTSWEHWCAATERSREHFAALVGVRVATGPTSTPSPRRRLCTTSSPSSTRPTPSAGCRSTPPVSTRSPVPPTNG